MRGAYAWLMGRGGNERREGRSEWNKGRKEGGRETGRERQKNDCRKAIKVEWNGGGRVREKEMKGM